MKTTAFLRVNGDTHLHALRYLVGGDDDLARLLVDVLVTPVRVEGGQTRGHAVVLAKKHHLDRREPGHDVDPEVT